MTTVSGNMMFAKTSAEVLRTAPAKPESAAAVLTAAMMLSANATDVDCAVSACGRPHVAYRRGVSPMSLARSNTASSGSAHELAEWNAPQRCRRTKPRKPRCRRW